MSMFFELFVCLFFCFCGDIHRRLNEHYVNEDHFLGKPPDLKVKYFFQIIYLLKRRTLRTVMVITPGIFVKRKYKSFPLNKRIPLKIPNKEILLPT